MNVTNFGWSVSCMTGTNIKGAVLSVHKRRGERVVNGYTSSLNQNGELDGKVFQTSEEAFNEAAGRGYTQKSFRRPNSFIHLRLSPATRRFLRPLDQSERLLFLMRICNGPTDMVSEVAKLECMETRLQEWMDYLDGKNPERRTVNVA